MVRVAIFIDHLNFEIATTSYYYNVLKSRSQNLTTMHFQRS